MAPTKILVGSATAGSPKMQPRDPAFQVMNPVSLYHH